MDINKKEIVFIEDNQEIFDLYGKQLEKWGYSVKQFSTGKAAMEGINTISDTKKDVPGIVILDLLLPDISGLALLKAIRERKTFDDTQVIILTNYESSTLAATVNKTPRVLYLTKVDTQPTELANIIAKYIS